MKHVPLAAVVTGSAFIVLTRPATAGELCILQT
jgi:hypothetical protein